MLRIAAAVLWTGLFFFFTSVEDPEFAFKGAAPQLRWIAAPDYADWFSLRMFFGNPVWLMHKAAHFISFAVLASLLLGIRGLRQAHVLWICLLVGIGSEWLQLHLDRTGRLYDAAIDMAGAWAAIRLMKRRRSHA